ncbi:MAG: hypothetical protein H6510_00830 [Acidobacteria bacterium]|nr:hypothetical protein [Acidobacteriota bacterium]MCB9396332.1 hypothetical protein [Acidobacteriota bacterium]
MKKWMVCLLVCGCIFGQQREDYDGSAGVTGPVGPRTWVQPRAVLFDNGPLVNSSGTGVGGLDESVMQNVSLGMGSLGFGFQSLGGNRVAEDFTISDPSWTIDSITFFAYQTGSTTTSSLTDLTLRIWDGPPGAVGSAVVWGDTSTNRLSSTSFTGIFRVAETTTGVSTERPIMAVVATVGAQFPAGTYWLDYAAAGSLPSGPWAPPITINGQTSTGNAMQSLDMGVSFNPLLDGFTMTPQGLPFIIEGSALSVPTFGAWGLLVFLVCMAIGGLFYLRRQRLA